MSLKDIQGNVANPDVFGYRTAVENGGGLGGPATGHHEKR